MFEHWMRFAPTLSARYDLDPEGMRKAHDIVVSLMSDAWLTREDEPRNRAARSIAHPHPLYLALNGQTEPGVLEGLRLPGYLLAFRTDPRLGDAVIALRDADKYEATLIELELAWGFRAAGGGA